MIVLAIDPGTTHSAFVLLESDRPVAFGKLSNEELLAKLRSAQHGDGPFACADHVAIEMIASYGMPVGAEVFETCVWIGRFVEAWSDAYTLVYRREVKLHLCGQARAKDPNVRQALIDRYGGRDKAIGRKATPGPLYGIAADVWSALAIALTWSETHAAQEGRAA